MPSSNTRWIAATVAAAVVLIVSIAAVVVLSMAGDEPQQTATMGTAADPPPSSATALPPATTAPRTLVPPTAGSPSGRVDGYDDNVLTNVSCPADIASDMGAALQGGEPGYLQARYEAGNFIIHVCTGTNGPIYHGQNIRNSDQIILPAIGDIYSGFTAVNGSYSYLINDVSLVIEVGGELLREDPVFAYEEH